MCSWRNRNYVKAERQIGVRVCVVVGGLWVCVCVWFFCCSCFYSMFFKMNYHFWELGCITHTQSMNANSHLINMKITSNL